MWATRSIMDSEALLADLRRCSEYASRAGLPLDRSVIDAINAAEEAIREGEPTDVHALMQALNEVTRAIAPMSVADLAFGRNPLSVQNQERSRRAQLSLSVFALVAISMIGYFTHALRVEQGAIASVAEVQALHPDLKLTALRNMAQHDEPVVKGSKLYEDFHERISELRRINTRLYVAYSDALKASTKPLFPWGYLFGESLVTTPLQYGSAVNDYSAAPVATTASLSPVSTASQDAASSAQPELCAQDEHGAMRLPPGAAGYPRWMQSVLEDTVSDFCFQLKVVSPEGDGANLSSQVLEQLAFASGIRDKVSLRVTWLLPFFYGLLGAIVFLMRDVASVRTPSMTAFPMIMRVCLGGIAGIIIGWFSSVSSLGQESTSTLSVPFALAFLTGYGIDVLFNTLDRLNRAIADPPKAKPA